MQLEGWNVVYCFDDYGFYEIMISPILYFQMRDQEAVLLWSQVTHDL